MHRNINAKDISSKTGEQNRFNAGVHFRNSIPEESEGQTLDVVSLLWRCIARANGKCRSGSSLC